MSELKQRILIVDDERALVRVVQLLLEHLGYNVDWAPDGERALQLGQSGNYAAVLCDLLMPVINGMKLYEIWQREAPELAQRVIFLTGDNLGTRTNRFLDEVDRPHLYKPFDVEDLTAAIHQVAGPN